MTGSDRAAGRLTSSVALVAGAASGIGRATALLFARQGAHVLATDIDESACQGLVVAADAGMSITTLRLDVTSEPGWERAVALVVEHERSFDILVVSAGITHAAPVDEITLETWRHVMAINLDGAFLGTKHAVRAMRSLGRGGSIVLVSSASGIKAAPGASAYAASKAALRLFARSVALECASDGIRVNTIHPGGVRTPMWTATDFWQRVVTEHGGDQEAAWRTLAATTPLKRFAEPDEIAQSILYLASDAASYTAGAELVIDGGFTA